MQSNQARRTLGSWFKTLVQYRVLLAVLSPLLFTGSFGVSKADWRTDLGVFRVGIVVGEDVAGNLARVELFRLALSEALGMNVEIFPARNMSSLIEAHRGSRIEYAIYSASAYAATWILCECVEPLVLPLAVDQTSTFRAVVISGPSGPGNLRDLKLENLAIPRSRAVGASEIAMYELEKQGVLPKGVSELAPTGKMMSSEQAVNGMLDGKFGAMLGWSSMIGDNLSGYSRGSLKALAEANGGEAAGYNIIWQSLDIPHPPHAIRKNLPAEAKRILRETLQQLFSEDPSAYDSIELQYGGGFAVARHGQFLSVLDFVRVKMGINDASSKIAGEVAGTGEKKKQ
ncbi:MAG: PhnD/SsuA/transferrin family substrate-binding protein [Rhizobiaceae bacterium]|nr:PhnD/SsuA/transferrin family substrate-binding protein [Rhizobiaceae bacterium]